MKVVTYNIHRCKGADGRYDPCRIASVLNEIQADIIGLQEVDTGLLHDERMHQLDYLVRTTGYAAIEGLIMEGKTGFYGNALLTRFEVTHVRKIDLSIRGASERRGALDVDLNVEGSPLRVIVAHLGVGLWERYFQVRRLIRELGEERTKPILMMGDFNIWSSLFPRLRRLNRRLGHFEVIPTFPSFFPMLSLDRLWVQPRTALRGLTVHRSPLSRLASDHLPLVGHLEF